MGGLSLFNRPKPEKKFGDPGYSVIPQEDVGIEPEVVREVLPSAPTAGTGLPSPVNDDQLRQMLSSYQDVLGTPAMPEAPEQPGLKQVLKEALISRVPIVGPAYAQVKAQQRQQEMTAYQLATKDYVEQIKEQRTLIQDGVKKQLDAQIDHEKTNAKVQTLIRLGVPPMEAMVRSGIYSESKANRIRVMVPWSTDPVPATAYTDGTIAYMTPDGQTAMGMPGMDPNILQTMPEASPGEMVPSEVMKRARDYQTLMAQLGGPSMTPKDAQRMFGLGPEADQGLRVISTVGPDGKPMGKFVRPTEGMTFPQPLSSMPTAIIETYGADGQRVKKIVPKVAGAEYDVPESENAQIKAAHRLQAIPVVEQLRDMTRSLINQKNSVAQRARAAGMTIESYVTAHPEFKSYMDARETLATVLARSMQGARLSDMDVKIAAKLVPNPFSDTSESMELKWELLAKMYGLADELGYGSGATAPQGGGAPGDVKSQIEKELGMKLPAGAKITRIK